MQNPIQKFRPIPIVFDEFQLPYHSIFFLEFLRTFPTYQCLQNDVWDFFYFV